MDTEIDEVDQVVDVVEKAVYDQLIAAEKTHFQWSKQGKNFFVFLCLAFVNLWRGSKRTPSLFGVEVCSVADWSSIGIYAAICFGLTAYNVRMEQQEQEIKRKYAGGLAEGVIDLRGGNLLYLLLFSFLGGFVAGALGLGGGAIFNPLLLSMGVPPKVASASGMYMIIFSAGAAVMTYLFAGLINLSYGVWVGGFCIIGTFLGMYALNSLMKKLNRQSPLVALLTFIFFISVVAVPVFGIQQLKGQENLWQINSIC